MAYQLDEKPGTAALLLYGLQWWVVSLPSIVIMGTVVARLHFSGGAEQIFYMQKLFALMGLAVIVQVLWGHRLPLVVGPASTLLVGLTASQAVGVEAVYTAIFVGGAALTLVALSGLLSKLRFFFTPRIVAVILALIAFTLAPTILDLLFSSGEDAAFHLFFAALVVSALVVCNAVLPGVWKAMTVLAGMAGGTAIYFAARGLPALPALATDAAPPLLLGALDLHAGAILSFLFCFLALLINELGSVESIGHMLKAPGMPGRIRRGVGFQGLTNMAAGGLGVIGSVDYSMSAGVIAATGCASRYTLIPAGLGLLLCAFSPRAVQLLSCIPSPVMGALLLYLMATQLASGLGMLVTEQGIKDFNGGMIVGLPLMFGLLLSFAPPVALAGIPDVFRPLLGNGFVMGTVAVIVLEHVVFRKTVRKV